MALPGIGASAIIAAGKAGMKTLTVVSQAALGGSAAASATLPAAQAGDVMLLFTWWAGGATVNYRDPSGFTRFFARDTSSAGLRCYYKVCTGSEGGTVVDVTNISEAYGQTIAVVLRGNLKAKTVTVSAVNNSPYDSSTAPTSQTVPASGMKGPLVAFGVAWHNNSSPGITAALSNTSYSVSVDYTPSFKSLSVRGVTQNKGAATNLTASANDGGNTNNLIGFALQLNG